MTGPAHRSIATHPRYRDEPGHLPQVPVGERVLRVLRVVEFQTRHRGLEASRALLLDEATGDVYQWAWIWDPGHEVASAYVARGRLEFEYAAGEGDLVRVVVVERTSKRGRTARFATWSSAVASASSPRSRASRPPAPSSARRCRSVTARSRVAAPRSAMSASPRRWSRRSRWRPGARLCRAMLACATTRRPGRRSHAYPVDTQRARG